jgi:hypothetical protein
MFTTVGLRFFIFDITIGETQEKSVAKAQGQPVLMNLIKLILL